MGERVRRLIEQLLKFGVVGAIAFAIDLGVTALLVETLGVNPTYAAAVAFVVAVCFNYVASMRFVFVPREDLSQGAQLAIFIALSVVGLIINEAIMWGGEVAFTAAGIAYEGSRLYVLVKAFASVVVALFNFFSRKRWLDAGE